VICCEEGGAFGLGVCDGVGDFAGETVVFGEEDVGLLGVEADFGGYGRCEGGEAAGDQQGMCAVGGHGLDEGFGAGGEADALLAALV